MPSLLALGVAAWMAVSAQTATPIVFDTDLGDDIDDTWALAFALARPELDVRLVTVASDNTPMKARLVAKILEHMGRTDVPIGIGPKNSDRELNQAAWLGDYALSDYPGEVIEDGVGALIGEINREGGAKTIVVIGPQTNLAAALERDAGIAEKARVVAMAGSVHVGYNGRPEPDAEWNVRRDPAAAQAVFAAPWAITYAPLDVCGTLTLEGDRYKQVANAQTPWAETVIANYNAWSNREHYGEHASSVLFDTVAVYLAYETSYCALKTVPLRVDDEGNTVVDEANGRPVTCALHWKDRDAFERLLVKSLTE